MLWANVLGQQAQLLDEDEDVFGRPWPTYSLQNMPKTQFTCRDKILGGYYADPETQCQMFHVCVKLPGVGVSVVAGVATGKDINNNNKNKNNGWDRNAATIKEGLS